jgi:hypothetical protein
MGESTEISVTFNPAPRNINISLIVYNLGAGGNGAWVLSSVKNCVVNRPRHPAVTAAAGGNPPHQGAQRTLAGWSAPSRDG